MVILGAFVLLVAIVVTVTVIVNGGQSVHINLHWGTLHTNSAAVFVIGAVCLALAVIGLWLLLAGLRGGYRRRKEIRSLRYRAESRERTHSESARGEQSATSAEPSGSRAGTTASDPSADDYFDSAPKDDGAP